MLKKTILLALTLLVTTAVPVSAQQGSTAGRSVEVTGLIERPQITTYQYGTHATTDEASGERYALASEEEGLLDRYVGERATVYGTTAPGYEDGAIEGGPPLVRVERVDPADGASAERVRVEVSLVIEGEAPENVSFYIESSAGGEVICTTDADVIAQAGYPECRSGANEAEIPVPEGEPFDYKILKSQGAALSQETVSEGSEVASDGLVVEATYSFNREERAAPVPGGGDKDLNADGAVNAADGQLAAEISDAARTTAAGAGQPVLPATGGPPLLPLALLLVAGHLAHRLLR